MSKELAALLLAANLSFLGGALAPSSAMAKEDSVAVQSSAVQSAEKHGSYELLSWDAIGGGRHPQGVVQDRATDC